MNLIVDTNGLLSAALRDRLPERVVLIVATDQRFRWLATQQILTEYVEVLRRPKFKLADDVVNAWKLVVELQTVKVASPSLEVGDLRDPKDVPFLAAALANNADYLITGDKDLLELAGKVRTRIVTVAEFAAEFQIS